MSDMKPWLTNALNAADWLIMQGYVNLAIDRLDSLDQDQKDELGCEIQRTSPRGPEDAAALAILAYLLEHENESPKPPPRVNWVKVDPFDFEVADDGDTSHYGGEIRITNDKAVDIVIDCKGDDRGDDECYWPTTEAILSALFYTVIPGVVDGGYAMHWEEFHDAVCALIEPMGRSFYVYVDQRGVPHRDRASVVILDADGQELVYPIPCHVTGE